MRKVVAFCSVAVIGVAALAGCSGSSTTGSGATPTTSASGGGSSNRDLSTLVGDAGKQKYKITYTSGDSNNSLTYAQDGNGNSVLGNGDSHTFVSKDGDGRLRQELRHPGRARSPRCRWARLANPFLGVLTSATDVLRRAGRSSSARPRQDHRGPGGGMRHVLGEGHPRQRRRRGCGRAGSQLEGLRDVLRRQADRHDARDLGHRQLRQEVDDPRGDEVRDAGRFRLHAARDTEEPIAVRSRSRRASRSRPFPAAADPERAQ